MIYITQLIFIQEGKEELFHEFENIALPIMELYTGKMLYRIRPDRATFIGVTQETPYEIHFISFDSETDLEQFMKDEERKNYLHLKESSIKSSIIVKGVRLS